VSRADDDPRVPTAARRPEGAAGPTAGIGFHRTQRNCVAGLLVRPTLAPSYVRIRMPVP